MVSDPWRRTPAQFILSSQRVFRTGRSLSRALSIRMRVLRRPPDSRASAPLTGAKPNRIITIKAQYNRCRGLRHEGHSTTKRRSEARGAIPCPGPPRPATYPPASCGASDLYLRRCSRSAATVSVDGVAALEGFDQCRPHHWRGGGPIGLLLPDARCLDLSARGGRETLQGRRPGSILLRSPH